MIRIIFKVNQIDSLNQLIGTPKDSIDVRKKLYSYFYF